MPDYRQIDWAQGRPLTEEFDDGLRRSRIRPVQSLDPRLEAVVISLNHTYGNGGALAAQFVLDVEPAVSWFLARNRLPESGFFQTFFSLAADTDDLGFALESPFVALGRLAQNISSGGAYLKFQGSDAEVLNLAGNFCDAAFGGRYSESQAYLSWKPWSRWFKGIAWDSSFFWLDKRTGIGTVLLVTDTD